MWCDRFRTGAIVKSKSISIRRMTERDGELFVRFYAALSAESLFFFTPHDPKPEKLRELVSGIAQEQNICRFAAVQAIEENEEMAGYVFLWDLDTGVPWLGICVCDSYKGQGIGTSLMRYVEQYCRKQGKGGILLTTHRDNEKAQGLYRKVGYETIGTDSRGELLMIYRLKDEN
jgi:ribosomal protein S18 acetylase RimI-like enzyme